MQSEAGKAEGNAAGKTTALRDELLRLGESADRHGTKVLRDNLELINHLVEQGVSLKTIYDKLTENGFRLTYKSYIQTLKLVRKNKRSASTSTTDQLPSLRGATPPIPTRPDEKIAAKQIEFQNEPQLKGVQPNSKVQNNPLAQIASDERKVEIPATAFEVSINERKEPK